MCPLSAEPRPANPATRSCENDLPGARDNIRRVRITIGKLLVAALLTLCIGLQALEATGRWDRTIQDTGDEAVIVTIALCVGAALVVAGAARPRIALAAIISPVEMVRSTLLLQLIPPTMNSIVSGSPPSGLRI